MGATPRKRSSNSNEETVPGGVIGTTSSKHSVIPEQSDQPERLTQRFQVDWNTNCPYRALDSLPAKEAGCEFNAKMTLTNRAKPR
ncbi:hypothetical protein RB12371 [Rhodopirellula baltica SH 1]|uniref:Uncharacterized protein n=1 Tax=Rhodopirellula baltica (strain DSM 10527 / NCIMB 13988 / SH1) TaxID=243090 RepID=Q7UIR7_RHOBA|nr:hypothetical protein RB12371 [Rhodopirellula baltica SH 1]